MVPPQNALAEKKKAAASVEHPSATRHGVWFAEKSTTSRHISNIIPEARKS